MGWTFGWYSIKELKSHILNQFNNEHYKLLDSKGTSFGKRLWVAFENKKTNKSFIALYLLQKSEEDWGYKDMDESMGPNYYDCPLELLDKTTGDVTSKYAINWRKAVREHHSEKKEKSQLKAGDIFELYDIKYTVISKSKKSWIVRANGVNKRMTPKHFKHIKKLDNAVDFILKEEINA